MNKDLEEEINKKIVILHGTPDMVLIPLYLWKEVVKEIYKKIAKIK